MATADRAQPRDTAMPGRMGRTVATGMAGRPVGRTLRTGMSGRSVPVQAEACSFWSKPVALLESCIWDPTSCAIDPFALEQPGVAQGGDGGYGYGKQTGQGGQSGDGYGYSGQGGGQGYSQDTGYGGDKGERKLPQCYFRHASALLAGATFERERRLEALGALQRGLLSLVKPLRMGQCSSGEVGPTSICCAEPMTAGLPHYQKLHCMSQSRRAHMQVRRSTTTTRRRLRTTAAAAATTQGMVTGAARCCP
jgi:hypothetical protein